jgi:hypothetical protein
MMPTGAMTDDLRNVVAREVTPLATPSVVVGGGVASAADDGSPSRDRLARIAAMIGHAEQAVAVRDHRQRRAPDARLLPLVARANRARRPVGAAHTVEEIAG